MYPEPDYEGLDDCDIIGAIKIKDGLFICDELGAQVSWLRDVHTWGVFVV
jgi:hypothetical protein